MKLFNKLFQVFLILIFFSSTLPTVTFSFSEFTHPFLPQTHMFFEDSSGKQRAEYVQQFFSMDTISFSRGESGLLFQLNGFENTIVDGEPKLPVKELVIPVEKNWKLQSAKTIKLKTLEMKLPNIPIETVPPWLPYHISSRGAEKKPSSMDAFSIVQFPKENFEIQSFSLHQDRFVRINIFPIYICGGKWYFTEEIHIKLIFVHKKEISLTRNRNTESVILAPDAFYEEALQLKEIQESQGYRVTVQRLSDTRRFAMADRPKRNIYYRGFADYSIDRIPFLENYDDQSARRIITMLQHMIKNDQINYLTIIGDASLIPSSYYIFSGFTHSFDNWIPTDLFYSSPLNKLIDFTFDIKVGRIPVRTKDEMKIYLTKLQRYHAHLDPEWFSQAAVMGGDPFYGEYMGELILANAINQDRMNGFQVDKYFRTEDKFNLPSFLDLMSQKDKGYIFQIGHGSGSHLYFEPGVADIHHCFQLPEKERLPIFISIACVNGAWDTQQFSEQFEKSEHNGIPTSFSQAMVLSKGGSIAYVGGARNNYGALSFSDENGFVKINDNPAFMAYLLNQFLEQIRDGGESLGAISNITLENYLASRWGMIDFKPGANTFFGFTLQGDPTIRLPNVGERPSYKEPKLSHNHQFKTYHDNFPLCPIDDGFNMTMESDSPYFNYYISQYHADSLALKDNGQLRNQNQRSVRNHFNPKWKTKLSLRIETKDFKENRFVFWSRYNHDLVMTAQNVLNFLRTGESQQLGFMLSNEGISDEKNITAVIEFLDQKKAYHFDDMPSMSKQFLWLNVDHQAIDRVEVVARAPHLRNEVATEDNQVSFTLHSPPDTFYRVGYWSQSTYLKDDRDPLMLTNNLNRIMNKNNIPVDFFPLYINHDEQDNSSMLDRIKPDLVILDSPDSFNRVCSRSYKVLHDYLQNGGKIISFAPVGKNSYNICIQNMQRLMNIPVAQGFEKKSAPRQAIEFSMVENEGRSFAKDFYPMTFEHVYSIKDRHLPSVFQNGKVLGSSADEKIMLIEDDAILFLNATLDWKSIKENPESIQFLSDLIYYAVDKEAMPFIKGIRMNPPTGTKNQFIEAHVAIDYFGSQPFEAMELVVSGHSKWEQTLIIDSFDPYEYREVTFPLSLHRLSGHQELKVVLKMHTSNDEHSQKIDQGTTYFTVHENREPDDPPILTINQEKYSSTIEKDLLLEGSTHPLAELTINHKIAGINNDGSFQVLIPLDDGLNTISIVSRHGSLETKKQVQIEKLKLVHVSMPIQHHYCVVNGVELKLDEPAVIVDGRTFVPVRFIAEAFEMKVEWQADEQKITLSRNNLEIILWVGKTVALINKEPVSLTNPPFIGKSNRTLLPLRFIAEGMGAKVNWDPSRREVTIEAGVPFEGLSESMQSFADPIAIESKVVSDLLPPDHVFPISFDIWEEEIYAITNREIINYNLDLEIISRQAIPESFWGSGSFEDKRADLSFPNRALLRVNQDYLVIAEPGRHIFVYDRESMELVNLIRKMDFGLSLSNEPYFSFLMDIELSEDGLLYLVDLWKIMVYDLKQKEWRSELNIEFNIDMALAGNRIYVSHVFEIGVYTLQGSLVRIIDPERFSLIYSLTMFDSNRLLVFNYLRDQIEILNMRGSVERSEKTSSRMGDIIEQMIAYRKKVFMLSFFISDDMPNIHSKLLRTDQRFRINQETHRNLDRVLRERPMYLHDPVRLWTTDDGSQFALLYNPMDPVNLVYINQRRSRIQKVPVKINYNDFSRYEYVVDFAMHKSKKFAVMKVDVTSLDFAIIAYDMVRGSTNEVKLTSTKQYSQYLTFGFNDQIIVAYDAFHCDLVFFDIDAGIEFDRVSLTTEGKMLTVNKMIFGKDELFFWDQEGQTIGSMDYNKRWNYFIDLSYLVPDFAHGIKAWDVDHQGNIYLLNHTMGSILKITQDSVQIWGENRRIDCEEELKQEGRFFYFPSLIAVGEHSMLIYDYGHQRLLDLPKYRMEIPVEHETEIRVYPEKISMNYYIDTSFQVPLTVQVKHQQEDIQIMDLPDYMSVNGFSPDHSSQVIHLVVDCADLKTKTIGSITFAVGEAVSTIDFELEPLEPYLFGKNGSPYLHHPLGYHLSLSALKVEKGTVYAGEDLLRYLGFDLHVTPQEIMIAINGLIFIIEPHDQNAWQIVNQIRVPIDLMAPVVHDGQQWVFPLNNFFLIANQFLRVDGEKVYFMD